MPLYFDLDLEEKAELILYKSRGQKEMGRKRR